MTVLQDRPLAAARSMTVTLQVCEELDVATAHRLREQLADALAVHPAAVVVDLHGCSFLDAQAIPPLLDAHRGARRREIGFSLRGVSPQARRLFALAGLQDVFTIEDER